MATCTMMTDFTGTAPQRRKSDKWVESQTLSVPKHKELLKTNFYRNKAASCEEKIKAAIEGIPIFSKVALVSSNMMFGQLIFP